MWSYRFVLQDVSRVIEGFGVDGVSRLPKTVSFPKRPDVVDAVVGLTQVLYTFIGATHRGLAQDHAARTAVVFKLLAFLTRIGRVTPDAVRASTQDIAGVATILSERPDLIAASVNFAGILARHTQAQQERAARREESQRNQAPPPPPPRRQRRILRERGRCTEGEILPPKAIPSRPIIWQSGDGQHCLQELIHPWHLVEETRALGHCIGRHPADYYEDGGSIYHLAYWQYIASGRSRIFSFAGPPGPLCTLHVGLPKPKMIEAGPKHPLVLTGGEPYFAALVDSIAGLEAYFGCRLRFDTGRSLYALRRVRGEGPPAVAEQFKLPRTRRYDGARRLNS